MNNWTVDVRQLKKHKKQYTIWHLEQLVNFGLGMERINREQLKRNWSKLNLDVKKKKYLSFLLWPTKQS